HTPVQTALYFSSLLILRAPRSPLFPYTTLFRSTLTERQIAQMPPFRYAVLIRCESRDQAQNTEFLQKHAALLRQYPDLVLDIWRSEEHTSELQSRENLVCRLLLEKKKKHTYIKT